MSQQNEPSPTAWRQRLTALFRRTPQSAQQLVDYLRTVNQNNNIVDNDTLSMIEGTISVAQKQVRDIMVPRAQMMVIHNNQSLESFLPEVIQAKHSRYPVIAENRDEVLGLLLAKDLISYLSTPKPPPFEMKNFLHRMTFVPESKRLDNLLKSFQYKHNHMAIVVDEYGGVSGLITIEDIIEEIVGEIEDEHYVDSDDELIKEVGDNRYVIQGAAPIEELNKVLNSTFDNSYFDTIGGLVAQYFGHLPQVGEHTTIHPFRFTVLQADKRRIRLLEASKLPSGNPSNPDT